MNKPKIIQFKLKFLSKPTLLVLLLGCNAVGDVYANSNKAINLSLGEAELASVQQNITVTGKVVSADDNMGIPGVNVAVKGGQGVVITDFDGNYSISVASSDVVLVFSSIGFKTKEIKVGLQKVINVSLGADVSALNEVVVVGYGTQKRATLTGAVETISSKVFEDRAVTNVGLALQGQTPGLVVTRNSSRPGNEGLSFAIRGASSVNGSDPLIIVDGVPVINDQSFQNMNSDDIESISVLKDGSAAIYGSRASNGVILVTTKRGKGKVKVTFNSNLRFTTNGSVEYSPSMQEYATMWVEANKEEKIPNWWIWNTEANVKNMQSGVEGKYDLFGTDFFIFNGNRIEEMFSTRYSYQHNLGISGGGDKSSYRLSLAYADNQGNLTTAYDGEKQLNTRFNYDYNLSEKLKLESSISITNTDKSQPSKGLGNILYSTDMPFYPAKNPYGQWFAPFNGIDGGAIKNSAATTADAGRYDKKQLTGRVDLKATYKIWDGISIEGLASVQNERFNHERYVVPVKLYDWYGNPKGNAYETDGIHNRYEASAVSKYYHYYQTLLHYDKTFNEKHNVSVMGGLSAEKWTEQWIYASRSPFEDLGIYDINVASVQTLGNSGFKDQKGRYSYLARLNYNYDEKYIAEFTGRKDGNSHFAKGYKFKSFGSAQLGWVFTKENFLSPISNILNFGKIRGSIASTGSEAAKGIASFDYLSLMTIGGAVLGQPASLQTASYNNALVSYTRTWERVNQKNVGIDLGFFKNRLTANFDIYEKDNIGMMVKVTYPSVLGGDAPKTNSGHFNTKGWEFMVGWKDNVKDFSYNVSFNIGDAKTLISGVENADVYGAGQNDMVNGLPWKPLFVYKTDGYFKDQAEVDAYYLAYGGKGLLTALQQSNEKVALRPGDTKRVDVAGTGNITDLGSKNSSLVYVGDGTAHYTFGINMGGSWKGFDLNTFFQGHLERNVLRNGYMAYPFRALFTNQNPTFLGKTWTEENPDAEFPRLTVNPTRAAWNYGNNDFMVQNSRYIRLKTVVVGYSLPEEVTKRMKLDKIRFYFSGNDLWEASTIKDGFDPEADEKSTDGDNAGYPFARTWSFGLNIGF
nr:TonB-dependent receptor [uncultured Flavobacterium sp.]